MAKITAECISANLLPIFRYLCTIFMLHGMELQHITFQDSINNENRTDCRTYGFK